MNVGGFDAVVFNYRGCAGTELTTPRAYNAADTSDMHQVMHHICELYPKRKKVAAGFSMGGILLVRFLSQFAEDYDPTLPENHHAYMQFCIVLTISLLLMLECATLVQLRVRIWLENRVRLWRRCLSVIRWICWPVVRN